MTGILRRIFEDERELPFLLIGGHAVILHGHSRSTFDLDLMVPEESLKEWESFLVEMGMKEFHRSDAFIQFEGSGDQQPVDLMVVSATTFAKLRKGSELRIMDKNEVRIPSAMHLVALKLHATRQEKRSRKDQDWSDIIGLIRSCDLDLGDETFHAIIKRYGGPEAETEIRKRLDQ
ncbi:MAG: hypothetical protein KDN20_01060 [Verrucomicrobiae bacterium]|nr:hypothetical protein [Verrucomicrobiae bacterium]